MRPLPVPVGGVHDPTRRARMTTTDRLMVLLMLALIVATAGLLHWVAALSAAPRPRAPGA